MDNNELIQQARELCEKATPGPWEVKVKGNTVESHQVMSPGNGPICSAISPKTKNAQFIATSRTLVPQLCDALEAMTARAEKAEAKIKSIHESLNFADKSRSKCANYVELAVSNGLALGKIAVAIQHDYDDEPPKGE